MKRVMKLSYLIAFVFMFIFLSCLASAATVTLTAVNSTLATVSITNAQNLYSYEVTYAYTGSVGSVTFYDFLINASDGTSTSNGYNLKGGNVSIYESRLDNARAGITGAGNLFNITYSGSLTVKRILYVTADAAGTEEEYFYNADGTTTVTVTTTGGGGGGIVTKVQQYAFKILSPGEIVIPKEGTIQVPIIIENSGQVPLKGIHLLSNVTFNNMLDSNIKIALAQDYIEELGAASSKSIIITINSNTQRQGIYKVTIFANIDSPKFSDWGEFYIEFKKTNESEIDNALTVAEELISKNVECLELGELLKDARLFADNREFTKSAAKIQEATAACENAIYKGSIFKSMGKGIDRTVLTYILVATLFAVVLGIIFYFYKRYQLKKGS